MVTPPLFKKFPTPQAMAKAKPVELEELIRSTGFYKSKAKSLLALSTDIVNKHSSQVPKTLEELTQLRGVGRKTANVVLGNAFGIPGLVVDTHVGRLSRRLGFTQQKDPVKVESEMMELVPRVHWTQYSHWLIYHGRAVCMARSPLCQKCTLADLCPKIGVVLSPAAKTMLKRPHVATRAQKSD